MGIEIVIDLHGKCGVCCEAATETGAERRTPPPSRVGMVSTVNNDDRQ